ncbi:hypothetical protein DBV15_05425 [Temnothorax longispinosus]|uniref:Uncharacterized protein n=1 Tax=Temnothorax longispinosus TaxID=300112 RepID=A0A4S2K9V4_9HYME|nr:hypothetical protein DBV15_05425 [Temnothorax longispinosus]
MEGSIEEVSDECSWRIDAIVNRGLDSENDRGEFAGDKKTTEARRLRRSQERADPYSEAFLSRESNRIPNESSLSIDRTDNRLTQHRGFLGRGGSLSRHVSEKIRGSALVDPREKGTVRGPRWCPQDNADGSLSDRSSINLV